MLQDGGMLVKPRSDGKRPGYAYAVDTGDFGTEAANVAANESARAGGDPGFSPPGDDSPTGPVDTGDFGSEVKNVAAVLDANRFRGDRGSGFFSNIPTPFNLIKNLLGKTNLKERFVDAPNLRSRNRFLDSIGYGGQFTPEFIKSDLGLETLRNLGYTTMQDRINNREDDDDDSQPIIPLIPRIATDLAEEDELAKALSNRTAYRFMADGGIMGGLADGQMDEMGRQMYGLGKLVKKVTRGVKKIAKSPVGKLAIGAAILGTPFGAGAKGTGFFGPKSLFGRGAAYFGTGSFNPLKKVIPDVGTIASPFAQRLSDFGLADLVTGDLTRKGIFATLGAASLLPLLGIGTGDESEEEAQTILKDKGIDIADIRANPEKYQAMRFMAEGGSTEKEPVAKKTMPLLDMDGMEKDYRAEGGFVPIGRMEKADDVPARLSKNEFVFTADAVRNAGDGNVDKGAEVMYNMMKNLEAGGDVSEESQGLEGARKMFQTSQRLEDVL
jgi:hypothetical protein